MTTEYTLRNKLLAQRSIKQGTLDDELAELMSKKWTMRDRIIESTPDNTLITQPIFNTEQLILINEEIKTDVFNFLPVFRSAVKNIKEGGEISVQTFITSFKYLFVKTILFILTSIKTPAGIVFMTITFFILYQYPIISDILKGIYYAFFILMYGIAHIINRVNVTGGNAVTYVENFQLFVDGYMATVNGIYNIKPNTLYLMDVATQTAVNVTTGIVKNATDDLKTSMTELVTNATDYLTNNIPNVTEIVGAVATVATMAAAANQATIEAFVASQNQELNAQHQERLMYEDKLLDNIVNAINTKIDAKFEMIEDTLSSKVEISVSTLLVEQQQYMMGYFEGIAKSQENILSKIDDVINHQTEIKMVLEYISSNIEIIKEIQDTTIRNEKYTKMITFTNSVSELIGSKNSQKVIGFIIKLIMNVGPQHLLKNEGGRRLTKSNKKRRKRRTAKRNKRTVKKQRRVSKKVQHRRRRTHKKNYKV